MMELIHMTATYSNALLVAILPHVSDFSKKLDLPVPQPITAPQVQKFVPSKYKDNIAGGIWLTNGYWYAFDNGCVWCFRSPDDVFTDQDPAANWPKYAFGKDNMTTNDAVAFAREALKKLGYEPEFLHVDRPPKRIEGPWDTNDGHHVPDCRILWESIPDPKTPEDSSANDIIQVAVNMEKKTITSLTIMSAKTRKPPPKLDVEPMLEKDFQKHKLGGMFIRTNAPVSPAK